MLMVTDLGDLGLSDVTPTGFMTIKKGGQACHLPLLGSLSSVP